MRVAVITSRVPYPLEKGDKLRMFNQLVELSQHVEIDLYCLSFEDVHPQSIQVLSEYCKQVNVYQLNRLRQYARLITSIFSFVPFQVSFFFDKSVRNAMRSQMLDNHTDLVYCQLVRCSEYVKDQSIPKVLDYMDCFSMNYHNRTKRNTFFLIKMLNHIESKRLARYEEKIYPQFDAHTIISERDRLAMNFPESKNISIVKNGVNMQYFSREAMQEKSRSGLGIQLNRSENKSVKLIFVGNMGYEPNYQAMKWFIDEVFPLLGEQFTLIIAGDRPPQLIQEKRSEKIHVTGWVEDIREAYVLGDIFIAPMFSGSGLQNKILEAMSMGIPVVTTSMVNQSILARDGYELFIADDVFSMKKAIEMLATDEEKRVQLKEAARKYVLNHYSWESCTQQLMEIINNYGQ